MSMTWPQQSLVLCTIVRVAFEVIDAVCISNTSGIVMIINTFSASIVSMMGENGGLHIYLPLKI